MQARPERDTAISKKRPTFAVMRPIPQWPSACAEASPTPFPLVRKKGRDVLAAPKSEAMDATISWSLGDA